MSPIQLRLQRRVDHPAADLRAGRGQRVHVLDVERGQLVRRCAGRGRLWAMNAWNASAVVAKPPGTETPSLRQLADHLAERGILAADLGQVGQTQVVQPQDAGRSRRHSGIAGTGPGSRPARERQFSAIRAKWRARRVVRCLQPRSLRHRDSRHDRTCRTIFYVSDGTGITAETIGHSVLTQFDGVAFRHLPHPVRRRRRQGARRRRCASRPPYARHGARPIVVNTIIDPQLSDIVAESGALMLDVFAPFIGPLEDELGAPALIARRARRTA